MKDDDRERLVEFLRRKMCGPCKRGDLNPAHEGCVEASELVAILLADEPG